MHKENVNMIYDLKNKLYLCLIGIIMNIEQKGCML